MSGKICKHGKTIKSSNHRTGKMHPLCQAKANELIATFSHSYPVQIIARLRAIVNTRIWKYAMSKADGGHCMIIYNRLWATMKKKGISQYKLINSYQISSGQLDRLRKNSNVSTYTLNQLCNILDCKLEDIAEFKKEWASVCT